MVAEIFGGIGAFKASLDILKTLKDASDFTSRQGIVIKLHEQILTAQAAQLELIQEVSALKAEITRFEKWSAEAERYQLRNIAFGTTAYVLKKDSAGGEPPHWICPTCYEGRKRSILQSAGPAAEYGPDSRKFAWKCHSCGAILRAPYTVKPAFAEDTNESAEG